MEFIAQDSDPAVVDDFILLSVKNRGGQMTPNSAMVELCNAAEKTIRSIDKLDYHDNKRVKARTLTYVNQPSQYYPYKFHMCEPRNRVNQNYY